MANQHLSFRVCLVGGWLTIDDQGWLGYCYLCLLLVVWTAIWTQPCCINMQPLLAVGFPYLSCAFCCCCSKWDELGMADDASLLKLMRWLYNLIFHVFLLFLMVVIEPMRHVHSLATYGKITAVMAGNGSAHGFHGLHDLVGEHLLKDLTWSVFYFGNAATNDWVQIVAANTKAEATCMWWPPLTCVYSFVSYICFVCCILCQLYWLCFFMFLLLQWEEWDHGRWCKTIYTYEVPVRYFLMSTWCFSWSSLNPYETSIP